MVCVNSAFENNPSGFQYGNGYDPSYDANYHNERFRLDSFFETPHLSLGVARNFLLQTEVFDNASWVKNDLSGTVSANGQQSPNGATTAENIPAGNSATSSVYQTITNSTVGYWTAGVWARMQSGTGSIKLRIDSDQETGTEKTIALTTKWQFFTVKQLFTTAHTTKTFHIIVGTNATTLWGARMNPGETPNAYYSRTTSAQTSALIGAFFNTLTVYATTFSGSLSGNASSATYTRYLEAANSITNTTDKTSKWIYIGTQTLTYNASYLGGRSFHNVIEMLEISTDNSVEPVGGYENFRIIFKGQLESHADTTAFNAAVTSLALEVEGKTDLTTNDICAITTATSTSTKTIRVYLKLKSANKHYKIAPLSYSGASYSGTLTETTSYNGFTFGDTIATANSLPTPAQGSVVYASIVYAVDAGNNFVFTENVTAKNLSGTNTGDQTIQLTGDVTGSGNGSFAATIAAKAVTLAKMADLAASSIIGNNTLASATPIALTATQVRTLINVADGANNYVHPNHTGDVTSVADGATTIAAKAVTLAKMADLAANSIIGNNTGGATTPKALTVAEVQTMLSVLSNPMTTLGDIIYGGASGLATRLAGNTTATRKFLAQTGDGSNSAAPEWYEINPIGGSTGATDNAILRANGAGGSTVQNSTVTIDDDGSINIPTGEEYLINSVNIKDVAETLTNKTLTAPKFASGGFIADNNGNEQIEFTTEASAVNHIGVKNGATGSPATLETKGGDTNIDLEIVPKGTGRTKMDTDVTIDTVPVGVSLEAENGLGYFVIPEKLNAYVLKKIYARVHKPSSADDIELQLKRERKKGAIGDSTTQFDITNPSGDT